MARTKQLSQVAKRRALIRLEAKLRKDLDKVTDKLAACLVCDSVKLEKEVRRLEQRHASERSKLAQKLGVEVVELVKTGKKTSKKKAAKKVSKKTSKKVTKKVAKKKAKKKASKKTSKKESG